MTRKETALQELREAVILNGSTEQDAARVVFDMRKYTIADIENETAVYKKMREQKEQKRREEEYFKSEEGAKKMAECKKRIEELKEQSEYFRGFYMKLLQQKFHILVPTLNGTGYEVAKIWENGVTLRNGDDRFLEIEIRLWRYDDDDNKEFSPEINIASCGSFVIDDVKCDRWKYYAACGEIIKNGDAVKEALYQTMKRYLEKSKEISKEAREIRKFMENPFANEK